MCGIAGIIIKNENTNCERHIQIMLEKQKHRGPDNTGYVVFNRKVFLGHNRLSIIDISDAANQPFLSPCGRYIMVFNGEIYNYLELRSELSGDFNFRTNSDTEVLLQSYVKWGKDCLNRLNGMFAFAIYDKIEDKLFAARDRFGVKPFYYNHNSNRFIFSSEIKSFFFNDGVNKKENIKIWASYLANGVYQIENETFWKDIYQLPAGHFLRLDTHQNLTINRWYDFTYRINELRDNKVYLNRSEIEHIDTYKELLENAVRLRFRSDVPVGFNISGGLDSSTLLGAVHYLHPDESINAYTFYCNDKRYDELPWVQKLIQLTNKDLRTCLLKAENIPELSLIIAYSQDEPYGGIPTIAYSGLFQKARMENIIVLLDGQGIDEAWAGYDYYHNNSSSTVQGVKSYPFRPEVLNTDFLACAENPDYPKPFTEKLLNLQYRDLFYTKIPRALRFNDRISMMYSTELREPFLDYRLVEYAFALSQEYKIQEGQVKRMLRKISQKYLSSEISLAPKRPIQTPQREWLSNELRDWVFDNIKIAVSKYGWLNKSKVRTEMDKFFNGQNENSLYIWQWISLSLIN